MPNGWFEAKRSCYRSNSTRSEIQRRCCKSGSEPRDLEALEKGIPNLMKHVNNIKNVYGLPCVVAINASQPDTKAELDL